MVGLVVGVAVRAQGDRDAGRKGENRLRLPTQKTNGHGADRLDFSQIQEHRHSVVGIHPADRVRGEPDAVILCCKFAIGQIVGIFFVGGKGIVRLVTELHRLAQCQIFSLDKFCPVMIHHGGRLGQCSQWEKKQGSQKRKRPHGERQELFLQAAHCQKHGSREKKGHACRFRNGGQNKIIQKYYRLGCGVGGVGVPQEHRPDRLELLR